jgi:2-keto-4-pentenoate hydratase
VPDLALADAAEAYRIQDAVAARLGGVAGWKVGAKGPGATPTCAPLLAGTVSHVRAGAAVRTRPVIGVEVEVAFVLGSDFPASPRGPDPDEILDAVSACHVAVEFCETRWESGPQTAPLWLLADNQMNEMLLLGPKIPRWRELHFAALEASLSVDAPKGNG